MQHSEISFYNCSDYVEVFWSRIPGEKQLDVVYHYAVMANDAVRWSSLHVGDTVHMVVEKTSFTQCPYLVTEVVTQEIDHTEVDVKVAALLADGALYVSYQDKVLTYEEITSSYFSKLKDDDSEREITRISNRYWNAINHKEAQEIFLSGAVVFTDEEKVIVEQYIAVKKAFDEIMRGRHRGY